ncbi:MAG TPA: ClpXP protease specificity-enhancing factor [Pseudomonadales bacterium]|nr:ClpXP protease specificity-enhancing factor [Pseudomonadales bacterium]
MLSSKSYLFRALYEWILDSHCTPHMVVDATRPDVVVPQQHIKNGQIVLNISPSAVVGFLMDNQAVAFSARFAGVPMNVHAPMHAILGIYARENGQGMMFDAEPTPDPDPLPPDEPIKKAVPIKPLLRVVK